MKALKILNNNIVYAADKKGKQVIVIGKGVGFHAKSGHIIDESRVEKVIPLNSAQVIAQLEKIPHEFFEISSEIVDYATEQIGKPINQNLYITLTDHISFCLERYKKGMMISNPLHWEIKHYYPTEYKIGQYAVELIKKRHSINLGSEEAAFIAMHVVCARYDSEMNELMNATKLVTAIVSMVQEYFGCMLDDESHEFQRFVTHARFLAARSINGGQWDIKDSMDEEYVQLVKNCFTKEYDCSRTIGEYIKTQNAHEMSEMELAYLTIHLRNMRKGNLDIK